MSALDKLPSPLSTDVFMEAANTVTLKSNASKYYLVSSVCGLLANATLCRL